MADYQEYRRRVLRKRWRRRFMAAALLLLLLLVGAIGMLWKSLHREQRPSGMGQNTILQEVTQDNTWNTASYAVARQLTVQTLADSAATALDFRMAALPKSSTAVGKEWFNDVSFVGDSLTQGMQLYEEGMQNAMFCAYKGVGPNVIVNGTTCKRADGVADEHVRRGDEATGIDARLFQRAGQQLSESVRAYFSKHGGLAAEFRHGGQVVGRCAAGMGGHGGVSVGIGGDTGKVNEQLAQGDNIQHSRVPHFSYNTISVAYFRQKINGLRREIHGILGIGGLRLRGLTALLGEHIVGRRIGQLNLCPEGPQQGRLSGQAQGIE